MDPFIQDWSTLYKFLANAAVIMLGDVSTPCEAELAANYYQDS